MYFIKGRKIHLTEETEYEQRTGLWGRQQTSRHCRFPAVRDHKKPTTSMPLYSLQHLSPVCSGSGVGGGGGGILMGSLLCMGCPEGQAFPIWEAAIAMPNTVTPICFDAPGCCPWFLSPCAFYPGSQQQVLLSVVWQHKKIKNTNKPSSSDSYGTQQ